MEIENCQIRGHVSQGSLYWMKNHWTDFHGLGRDCQENKRPLEQTLCGWRFGKIKCTWKHRNAKKNKSGLPKNRGLTMVQNCVVFTSLIQLMKNSRIL